MKMLEWLNKITGNGKLCRFSNTLFVPTNRKQATEVNDMGQPISELETQGVRKWQEASLQAFLTSGQMLEEVRDTRQQDLLKDITMSALNTSEDDVDMFYEHIADIAPGHLEYDYDENTYKRWLKKYICYGIGNFVLGRSIEERNIPGNKRWVDIVSKRVPVWQNVKVSAKVEESTDNTHKSVTINFGSYDGD